eukprot:2813472-Heterocapsa_arctica.AAC.1
MDQIKIAEHSCRHTSRSSDEQIDLKEHVDCMKEGRSEIRYITDEIIVQGSSLPLLETVRRRGLEVFYT